MFRRKLISLATVPVIKPLNLKQLYNTKKGNKPFHSRKNLIKHKASNRSITITDINKIALLQSSVTDIINKINQRLHITIKIKDNKINAAKPSKDSLKQQTKDY
jgi:hypothetical protein